MSRPLEFRAWDTKQGIYNDNHGAFDTEGIELNELIDFYHSWGFVLEQFTGLLDKNGTKIFENDIANDGIGNIGIVIFRDGKFDICQKDYISGYIATYFEEARDTDNWEVIGNVHQNPELLK